jgi:hypothetical protein
MTARDDTGDLDADGERLPCGVATTGRFDRRGELR